MNIDLRHRLLSLVVVILAAVGMAAEINARVWLSDFVGDEALTEPHDKRSVRGVAKYSKTRTSATFHSRQWGSTSPMYIEATPLTPRTLRLSRGSAYKPSSKVLPNGFISSGRMHYYVKDYQGNVRQVTDADGVVEQDNHYYPYGMLMGESSNILASARGYSGVSFNPYLFGSKEYMTTASANLLDFTARTYDPTTLLFQTQDPKADVFTSLNSYLYCASDPINKIDPTGEIVYIVGTAAEEARSQLQSIAGDAMTLSLDDEGKLTYTVNNSNKELKGDAKRMAEIIDNQTITVDLNTTDSKFVTPYGTFFAGGAFLGNIVRVADDKTVTVEAGQYVNTKVLNQIDTATGKPGASMFHELTEGYQGALIAQKSGKDSARAGVKGSVYETAHRRASPPTR